MSAEDTKVESKVEAKGARRLTGRVVSTKMQKTIAAGEAPDLRQVHPAHDQAAGAR